MKIIKKLSIIMASILLLAMCLAAFSACNKNYDTFVYYYFSDEWGEYVRRPRTQITMSKDRDHILLKDGTTTLDEDVETDGRKVYIDKELKYYASEYFIAPTSAMRGQAIVDDDFNGKLIIHGVVYDLRDGLIYSENGDNEGDYSVKNSYVTIAISGERREYMFMRISKEGETQKTVGLFDEFYAMIDVLADNVDNTGIVLNKSILLVGNDDEIVPTPKTKGYKFNNVSYEVVSADGYELEIDENGKYDLKIVKAVPSDKITVKITADGLQMQYDFLPISVIYDKSLMVMRFTGDSIDFDNKLWYLYTNLTPDNVSIRTVVIHGAENCELSDNVLTFTNSGVVVVKMIATVNIGNDIYVLTDEASINVSERYID